jgi:hypothetical protein
VLWAGCWLALSCVNQLNYLPFRCRFRQGKALPGVADHHEGERTGRAEASRLLASISEY